MTDGQRLRFVAAAVRYCKHARKSKAPVTGYRRMLREVIYFAWVSRLGPKIRSAKYCSPEALNHRPLHGEIIYDHAIPINYGLDELLDLTVVTPETVQGVLDKYCVCALITAEQDAALRKHGLQNEMPMGRKQKDYRARYKVAKIKIVKNPKYLS